MTADFATCQEVDDDLIDQALAPASTLSDASPREKVFELIERMAEVSRPRQGAFRVLFVFARMAGADWLEGQIELRLHRDDGSTNIEVLLDDGLSLNRLHRPLAFDAPFNEFARAIDHQPPQLSPLRITSREPGASVWLRPIRDDDVPTLPPGAAVREELFEPRGPMAAAQSRPTKKVRAVKIPREAYRDEPQRPHRETPRARAPESNAPTRRFNAAPDPAESGPKRKATPGAARPATGSPDMVDDELDAGWD